MTFSEQNLIKSNRTKCRNQYTPTNQYTLTHIYITAHCHWLGICTSKEMIGLNVFYGPEHPHSYWKDLKTYSFVTITLSPPHPLPFTKKYKRSKMWHMHTCKWWFVPNFPRAFASFYIYTCIHIISWQSMVSYPHMVMWLHRL